MAKIQDITGFLTIDRSLEEAGRKIDMPKTQAMSAELTGIAAQIGTVTAEWNVVELCTHSREVAEREKALLFSAYQQGTHYNPTFHYPFAQSLDPSRARREILALHAKLHQFWPTERAELLASHLLESKIIDALATCDLAEAMQRGDENQIDAALDALYPAIDPASLAAERAEYDLYLTANRALPGDCSFAERAFLETRMLSPAEQRVIFEWALECYGLLRHPGAHGIGFQVKVSPDVFHFDVRHRSAQGPTVFIPGEPLSARRVLELVRHEIEAHARQSANGEALFFLGGAFAQNDETLYEGLAMRYEYAFIRKHFGPHAYLDPRFFGLAMQCAEDGMSFSSIFALLAELYWPMAHSAEASPAQAHAAAMEHAWSTVYRVFRGHIHTQRIQAAMRKDQAYIRGEQLDRMLCDAGKGYMNEMGIIALRDLPILAEFALTPDDPVSYTHLTLPTNREV